jgi:hypothetical protein
MADKKNIIQVFGLHRSGTNFIEWSLKNNFEGLEYDGRSEWYANVPGDEQYGGTQSLKHTLPTLVFSDYAIVVRREFKSWNRSVRNKFPHCNFTKETYDYYYHIGSTLNSEKCIFIDYEWVCDNYKQFLDMIEEKFGYKIKENWFQPKKRLATDGGESFLRMDWKKRF